MPASYTHDTFGRIVYKELEGEIHWLIHKYSEYFRIGLQGPDVLFFYRPLRKNDISEVGYQAHRDSAAVFFERAREIIQMRGKDTPHCAYALGVLCHFMLDSECHPYVERMVEETGISHNRIETEWERFLLKKSKQDPKNYRIGKLIPDEEAIAWVIHEFYEGVTPKQMHQAMKSMRQLKGLLHVTGSKKEKLVHSIMKVADRGNGFKDLVMDQEAMEACRPISRELFRVYKEAVLPTVIEIHRFYSVLETEKPLPERLKRNFD